MKLEEKKLHFIEDYLKVSDIKLIDELDVVLRKQKKKTRSSSTFKKHSGIISNKEAKELSKIIEEGCETIDTNEWK